MIFEQDADAVARPDGALAQDVAEYEQLVRESVSTGQLLTAIEVARDGLTRFGRSRVLQQQLALALTQTGALETARDLLIGVLKESSPDEETLCLLGRVYKDIWRRAASEADAKTALEAATKAYGDAFERYGTYYPGINLAFTLAASGNRQKAAEVARQVAKLCRIEIDNTKPAVSAWLYATLGEALVHQGATTEAAENYRKAAEIFRGRWRDLASMRRQAREIIRFKPSGPEVGEGSWFNLVALQQRAREFFGRSEKGEEWLDRCFQFPSVVVFSGHMVDHPGRTPARFPAGLEPAVRDEIRQRLQRVNAGFGYSSAAAGADIIFCECLLEMDAKVNLVLPCAVDAFKRQSVSFAGPDWERRFHHVLAHANSCVVANPAAQVSGASHQASPMGLAYANRMATGLAALQAQSLDLEFHPMALWDGTPSDQLGGTANVIGDWNRHGLKAEIVHLATTDYKTLVSGLPLPDVNAIPTVAMAETLAPQEIKPLLFAEAVNFHKVGEDQMPAFVQHYKGAIAKLMETPGWMPAVAESWAGAHYFAYDSIESAARFALAFRDVITKTDWKQFGLPGDLSVRIVLHAGPVFSFVDPTLRRMTCVGAHLNRVARIWPITPAGQIYATQGFGALCGAERVTSVSFEYLGYLRTTTLFEDTPLFRMDRRQ